MNQEQVLDAVRKLKSNPNLKRKLKIFAAVAVVGFLVTSAITVWAGFAAFKYVSSITKEFSGSALAQNGIDQLSKEVSGLPKINAQNCLAKAQSLLSINAWLGSPAIDNLLKLKTTCLKNSSNTCEGKNCNEQEEAI